MTRMRALLGVALVGAAAFSVGADTVTVEPTRDATLYDSPDGSVANGAGQHAFVGLNSGGNTRRTLLAFDIAAAIPTGSTITAVTLAVNVSSAAGSATAVTLHRATTGWSEGPSDPGGSEGQGAPALPGDATWLHTAYDGAVWATPGGDFDPVSSTSTVIDQPGAYAFASSPTLIADIQAWLDLPASNLGWIMLGDESGPGTAKRLDSRDHPDPSLRPTLTVSYLVPAPGAAAVVLVGVIAAAPRRRRRR